MVLLGVGTACSFTGLAVPAELRPAVIAPLVAVALVLGWIRALRIPAGAPGPRVTFCAGGTIMYAAALVRFVHGALIGEDGPLPSPADALYLLGYALFLSAAVQFLRARDKQP